MLHERLKELRTALGLSQVEFSERILVGSSTLAMWELGSRKVKDIHISKICSEFNVSEKWLRTGEGEMTEKINPDNSIIEITNSAVKNDKQNFQKNLLYTLSQLTEDQWSSVESTIDILINVKNNKSSDKA